jgi:hypothetical protein
MLDLSNEQLQQYIGQLQALSYRTVPFGPSGLESGGEERALHPHNTSPPTTKHLEPSGLESGREERALHPHNTSPPTTQHLEPSGTKRDPKSCCSIS